MGAHCQKHAITDERYVKAEQQLLGFSEIPLEDFEITNVPIGDGNEIRTYQLGDVSLSLLWSLEE